MAVSNRFFQQVVAFVILTQLPLYDEIVGGAATYWENHGLLFTLVLLLQPQIALLFFSQIPWTVSHVLASVFFPEVAWVTYFLSQHFHYKVSHCGKKTYSQDYYLLFGYLLLSFARYFEMKPPQPSETVRWRSLYLTFASKLMLWWMKTVREAFACRVKSCLSF